MSCRQLRELPTTALTQLGQLTTLTHSGDLISNSITEKLVESGLALQIGSHEFYVITDRGVRVLETIGYLRI